MNFYKKLILPLLVLPILFFAASNLNYANAQTTNTSCSTGLNIENAGTSSIGTLGNAKIYKIKVVNSNKVTCNMLFKGTPYDSSTWTFSFWHTYSGGALSNPINSSNPFKLIAGAGNSFYAYVLPSQATQQKAPTNYRLKISSNITGNKEYTDIFYNVTAAMSCTANDYCGTVSLGSAGQLSCGNTCKSGQTCNTSTHKCVTAPNPKYQIALKSYIDDNNNSLLESGDACKGGASVKITQNGAVKATKTTACPDAVFYSSENKAALLNITAPSGFKVTGLQVKENGATTFTKLTGATSVYLRDDAVVRIGLLSLNADKCDNDSQCKTKNANKPACKSPASEVSSCVQCTAANSSACNANQKCENNVCVAKDTTGGGGSGGGTSACNPNPPGLEVIDPANKTRSGAAGTQKTYTLKVINKDTGDCPARTFVLSKEQFPSDKWSGSFSANNLSIAKGGNKQSVFTVKSPDGASNGEKNISVGVRKEGQTTAQVKQALTYIITAGSGTVSKSPSQPPSGTVSEPPTACQRVTPEVVVEQDKSAVKAGGKITYTFKVTNNDTANCSQKNLKLALTVPNDNWTKNLSDNEFSLQPGARKNITGTVDSPAGATNGDKDVKLIVRNANGDLLATVDLSFIVSDTPATVSPPISEPPVTPGVSGPISPEPDQAYLYFNVGLDGIGTTQRINIGGNPTPINTTKDLTFQLRDPLTNNVIFDSGLTPFGYDSNVKLFKNSFTLPSNIANGTYNVFLSGAPYLSRRYPVSVTVNKGQITNLTSPVFYMITGNIDDDGQSKDVIDVRDYNILMSCSVFSKDSTACDSNANFLKLSDLNSDGTIDQSDYTLWLKEKGIQRGDLPE